MNISIIEPGGLNLELALLFANNGHNVGYFSEYREAFPTGQRESIGTGFKGVTRFKELSKALEFGEIIVCPDTHSQDYLALAAQYKKPTWGAGRAERFEQDRLFAKQMLESLDLPVGKYYHGCGLIELETCLKKHNDLYVKFPGSFRGCAETCHHYDWNKTRTEWWGHLMADLGPEIDTINWIAEEPIEHIMEVASDQMVVNGHYSLPTIIGIEDKDSAYIGKIMDEVPKCLQEINTKLVPYLCSTSAKTFFSPELMIGKDGKCYLTDPCLRSGHPVNAVQLDLYKNLCPYILAATTGANIPIIARAKYGIALEIKSSNLTEGWLEIQFDESKRKNIHLQCARKVKDKYYVIPHSFIAATIVGIGNTLDEAEKEIRETLKSFSCDGMYYDINSIEKIKQIMKKGVTVGIKF
jgi:hypothetical protein